MLSTLEIPSPVPVDFITDDFGPSLYLKREDQLHPEVSGNKFRKLKYNLKEAVHQGKRALLTFGGAYSNHIAATAAAGNLFGLETIGVIRGEELGQDLEKTLRENPTLKMADSYGMRLKFVSRSAYREKASKEMKDLLCEEFGDVYLLPEGGSNALAVKGCEEILTQADTEFDLICCAVGTGGTIAGLSRAAKPHQRVLGFPALKGDFLSAEIRGLTPKTNWELVSDYHFGGYAKIDRELIGFINEFRRRYGVLLDPVYTGKMMFGLFDLMQRGHFSENPRILAVHTGGLQGIAGMNRRLQHKDYPLIDI